MRLERPALAGCQGIEAQEHLWYGMPHGRLGREVRPCQVLPAGSWLKPSLLWVGATMARTRGFEVVLERHPMHHSGQWPASSVTDLNLFLGVVYHDFGRVTGDRKDKCTQSILHHE